MTPSRMFASAICVLVLAPIGVIFSSFLTPADDVWRHFASTILGELIVNTLALAVSVAAGSCILGVGLAWLTAVYDFPGRKFFSWALFLPLALPAYVIGFVAVGLLDFTGPIQGGLRSITGSALAWFPSIRSGPGVVLVLVLALYPYVYLLARNAFRTQGRRMIEAGRALGLSARQAFWRVAVPMARPWIATGALLVVMETLADFGTVAIFNYDTLTSGVYKAWFGLFSVHAAAQVASILILLAFFVLVLEQATRQRMRFATGQAGGDPGRAALRGRRAALATAACAAVFALAFAAPVLQLTAWGIRAGWNVVDGGLVLYLGHSLLLGALAACMVTAIGLVLAYVARRNDDALTRLTLRLSMTGYAVPGAVLAVGVFLVFAWIDRGLAHILRAALGAEPGLVLQGTVAAILVAYVVRFLAVGFGPIDSAMHRVTRSIDEAATVLGHTGTRLLRRVHLPMLRGGLAAAAILVMVDVMKEMPITLMTRPFGWDTLAVRIFELTSEAEWELAAVPALILAVAGLLPVFHLTRVAGRD